MCLRCAGDAGSGGCTRVSTVKRLTGKRTSFGLGADHAARALRCYTRHGPGHGRAYRLPDQQERFDPLTMLRARRQIALKNPRQRAVQITHGLRRIRGAADESSRLFQKRSFTRRVPRVLAPVRAGPVLRRGSPILATGSGSATAIPCGIVCCRNPILYRDAVDGWKRPWGVLSARLAWSSHSCC